MHMSKRRRISALSESPHLSAFAAKQILVSKNSETSSDFTHKVSVSKRINESLESSTEQSLTDSSLAYRELETARSSIPFSTIVPDDNNFQEFHDGSKLLVLSSKERLVVIGQYEISVLNGEITLLGATLGPSKKYRVYAPPTHSLPVIRCAGNGVNCAQISLSPIENGLEVLESLSPLFGNIWNECSETTENCNPKLPDDVFNNKIDRFKILFSPSDKLYRTSIQPLVFPPEWDLAISSCTDASTDTHVIFICGPKGTGKSTFAKILLNKILLESTGAATPHGVMLLDLDPGQPEYSPPGQLSLIHIKEPNFGPPFSHPVSGYINKTLRAHSIGAISPNSDPAFYKECALDLFSEYCKLLSYNPNYPLVINTPGWVLGTGLEILVDLIENIRPTDIIYMSLDGPSDVVETLRETEISKTFTTLPSHQGEHSIRTAAQLRQMQYISYFHLNPIITDKLSWNSNPLTSVRPYEVKYLGEPSGILGIICYGENSSADLLFEALNGSLVSVVVLDDLSAIPGLSTQSGSILDESNNENHVDSHKSLQGPVIIRSPEDIPYFNPLNSTSLHPKKSRSLGLALIRGIDVSRHRIQVITTISHSVIEEVQEARMPVVFVHGKLDSPGWAYTEQLLQAKPLRNTKQRTYQSAVPNNVFIKNSGILVDEKDNDVYGGMFRNIPWVERLEGHQGRSVGSFVWRVRRDLGKLSDKLD